LWHERNVGGRAFPVSTLSSQINRVFLLREDTAITSLVAELQWVLHRNQFSNHAIFAEIPDPSKDGEFIIRITVTV
jgi:hypothetical protein